MATLSLEINPARAEQAAKTFMKVVQDIQDFIAKVDASSFTKIPVQITKVIESIAKLHGSIDGLQIPLATFSNRIKTIIDSDPGGKLATSFGMLKAMIHGINTDVTALGTALSGAAHKLDSVEARTRTRRGNTSTSNGVTSASGVENIAPVIAATAASFAPLQTAMRTTSVLGQQNTANLAAAILQVSVAMGRTGAPTAILADGVAKLSTEFRLSANNSYVLQRAINGTNFSPFKNNVVMAVQELHLLNQMMQNVQATAQMMQRGVNNQKQITGPNQGYAALYSNMASSRIQIPQYAGQTSYASGAFAGVGIPANLANARSWTASQQAPRTQIQIPQNAGPNAYGTAGAFAGAPRNVTGTGPNVLGQQYGPNFASVQQAVPPPAMAMRTKVLREEVDKLKNSNTELFRGLIALQIVFGQFTIGRMVGSVRGFVDELYQTGERLQIIKQTFKSATGGDVAEASHLFAVAGDTSKKMGIDFLESANSLARLTSAAKGSSLEGAGVIEVYKGVSAAQAVLGSNSEHASNVIKVFTDIMSKGRVQSEELVKQFGNSVPGAFRLAAQALGKTTQELQQDMQRGTLEAGKTVLAIGRALSTTYGKEAFENAEKLKGSYANLGSAYSKLKEQILLGGAEQGMITFYKTLAETLENPQVIAAARAIGEVLGVVLTQAVRLLTFAIETFAAHWQLFAAVIAGFVGTGVLVSLATTVGLVIIGFSALGPAALPVLGVILILGTALEGLTRNFLKTHINMEKIGQDVQKFKDDWQKAMDHISKPNTNAPDLTRAFSDALQTIDKEIRTFSQDAENQADAMNMLSSGVSSLSSEFDAYGKTLERIKALERANKFDSLSAKDAEGVKRQVTDILFQIERTKIVLESMVKMRKELDQRQQNTSIAQTTFRVTSSMRGNISPMTFELQKEYDDIVIPALMRVREQLKLITDPAQAKNLIENFNSWNKATLQSVMALKQVQDAMKSISDMANEFREVKIEMDTTQLLSTIRVSEGFTKTGADVIKSLKGFAEEYVRTQDKIKPPEVRNLGKDLQDGFNPAHTGEMMGHSFTKIFIDAMNEAITQLVTTMKTQLMPQVGGGMGSPNLDALKGAGNYQDLVKRAASAHGVDPELIARIIKFESNWDPNAVGHNPDGSVAKGGGKGLMQLVNSTARELGVNNSFDPEENVMGGSKYWKQLLDKENGNLTKALTRYRGAGPDKDPAYFRNILGGYEGTGYTPVGGVGETKTPLPVAGVPQAQLGNIGGLGGRMRFKRDTLNPVASSASGYKYAIGPTATGEPMAAGYYPTSPTPSNVNPYSKMGAGSEFEQVARSATDNDSAALDAIKKRAAAMQEEEARTKSLALEQEKAAKASQNAAAVQAQRDGFAASQSAEYEKMIKGNLVSKEALTEAEIAGMVALERAKSSSSAMLSVEQARNIVLAATARMVAQRLKQFDSMTLGIEMEARSLQIENKILDENNSLRAVNIDRAKREQAFRDSGVTDPTRVARFRAGSEQLAQEQIRGGVVQQNIQTRRDITDIGFDIESLRSENIERSANLEARRSLHQLQTSGLPVMDQEYQTRLKLIESLRQQSIALAKLNGPFQQAIDSIPTLEHGLQSVTVNGLQAFGDALTEFAMTGKMNFKSLVQSIGADLMKLFFQIAVMKPMLEGLNAPSSGSTGGGGFLGTILNVAGAFTKAYAGGGTTTSDPAAAFAVGGWVGRGGTVHRFANGGLVGNDTIPAMLSPGETVRTPSQEAALRNRKGGDNYHFNVTINATDGDSVKQTTPQVMSEIYKNMQRNAKRNGLERRS